MNMDDYEDMSATPYTIFVFDCPLAKGSAEATR